MSRIPVSRIVSLIHRAQDSGLTVGPRHSGGWVRMPGSSGPLWREAHTGVWHDRATRKEIRDAEEVRISLKFGTTASWEFRRVWLVVYPGRGEFRVLWETGTHPLTETEDKGPVTLDEAHRLVVMNAREAA